MKYQSEASCTNIRPPNGRVATTTPPLLPPTPYKLLSAPGVPPRLPERGPDDRPIIVFIVGVFTVGACSLLGSHCEPALFADLEVAMHERCYPDACFTMHSFVRADLLPHTKMQPRPVSLHVEQNW